MKKLVLQILGALSIALATSGNATGDDGSVTANGSVGFYTDYMWRGSNLYDGTSIQPSVGLSFATPDGGSIDGNVWAHLSGEGGKSTATKFTEIDYTLSYTKTYDAFSFSLGHIFYTFPEDSDGIVNSNEIFASVGLNTLLSPTLSVFHDYRAYDNQYYELGFSHTFEDLGLGEGFNITPFVALGFVTDGDKAYQDDGLIHHTYGVSFDAALGDVTLFPSLNVTRESDASTQNEFWAGMNLGYDF